MFYVVLMCALSADPSLPKMANVLDAMRRGRDLEVIELEKEKKQIESYLSKNSPYGKLAKIGKKRLEEIAERVAVLQGPEGYAMAAAPTLVQKDFTKDQVGMLKGQFKIVQVLSDTSVAMIEVDDDFQDERFHLTGVNVKDGYADGDIVDVSICVEVVGTMSYTTVLGAKATVFVLEKFEPKPYLDELKKRHAKANKTAKKPKPKKKPVKRTDAEKALAVAKLFLKTKPNIGRQKLKEVIKDYPDSDAAKEAKKLLAK